MEIFDLDQLAVNRYENKGMNVFYKNNRFKTRMIEIEPNGSIPQCLMESNVIFICLHGEVTIHKNEEVGTLSSHQVFISEPALIAMESIQGARLMGIQIKS